MKSARFSAILVKPRSLLNQRRILGVPPAIEMSVRGVPLGSALPLERGNGEKTSRAHAHGSPNRLIRVERHITETKVNAFVALQHSVRLYRPKMVKLLKNDL